MQTTLVNRSATKSNRRLLIRMLHVADEAPGTMTTHNDGSTSQQLMSVPVQHAAAHVVRKDYNVCITLNSVNGEGPRGNVIEQITLCNDVHRSVFTNLPLAVSLALVVDDQPAAGPAPGTGMAGCAKGWICDCSSDVRSQTKMWFDDKLDARKYAGYKITRYTAESGSPAGPRLTLYLKSPAVQRQEVEAAEALAEATGWVTLVCYSAGLPTRFSKTNRIIQLKRATFIRAFPAARLDGMSLQLELFKDNVAVQGVDGSSTLRSPQNAQYVTIRISASAASALVGCRLQQVQAKSPNLLRVYSVTCPDSTRLQTPVNQRTAATRRLPTPRSAAAADNVAPSARSTSAMLSQQAAVASADQALLNSFQQQAAPLGIRPAKQAAAAAIHQTYHSKGPQSGRRLVQQQAVNSSSGHLAAVAAANQLTAKKRNSQALGTYENASTAITAGPAAAAAVQQTVLLEDRSELQPKKKQPAAIVAHMQLTASPRVSCGLAAALRPEQVFQTNKQPTGFPPRTTAPAALAAETAAGAAAKPLLSAVGTSALPERLPQLPECQLTGAAAARAGVANANVNLPRQPGGIPAACCSMPALATSKPEIVVISDSDSGDGGDEDGQHTAWQQNLNNQQQQQQKPIGHRLSVKPLERPTARQHARTPAEQNVPSTVTTAAAGAANGAGTQHKIKLEKHAAGSCAAAATELLQPPLQVQTTAEATTLAAAVETVGAEAHICTAAQLQAAVPAALPCTAGPSRPPAAAPSGRAARAPATAAPSATTISALPPNFTLTDCNSDILLAGRQLTDLLDHLHAPDHQVMQLNDYIISLSHQSGDDHRVVRFWYDYSQIRLWVRRRNEQQCRVILHQMLNRFGVRVPANGS